MDSQGGGNVSFCPVLPPWQFGSFGLSVCLFVYLSVDNITQKVINGLG